MALKPQVLFINNFCTHYTAPSFEVLAGIIPTRFLFFSDAQEKYWESENKLVSGRFNFRYLPGLNLGGKIRITPSLAAEILKTPADAVVMALSGRFALPIAYLAARLARKPFILWTGLWAHPGGFFHRLSWPLLKWIYLHSDAIIVYGSHVKKYLVEIGVDPAKIFIFWHSVDTDKMGRLADPAKVAEYRARWSPDGSPIVLSVGRVDKVKSLDTLVEACARLSHRLPLRLVVVGRGPERANLERLGTQRGLSVVFEDFIPNDRLPEVYAAASVFVLPSRTTPAFKEPWGLVVNEAMLQGCVPVASDAVGAAMGGLFDESMKPLVFPERQAGALESCLAGAIQLSGKPEFREQMKTRSRKFNPRHQVEGLLEALRYLGIDKTPG